MGWKKTLTTKLKLLLQRTRMYLTHRRIPFKNYHYNIPELHKALELLLDYQISTRLKLDFTASECLLFQLCLDNNLPLLKQTLDHASHAKSALLLRPIIKVGQQKEWLHNIKIMMLFASSNGDLPMIKYLFEFTAQSNLPVKYLLFRQVLEAALKTPNFEEILYLFTEFAPGCLQTHLCIYPDKDPMSYAVEKNHAPLAKFLLECGDRLMDEEGQNRWTPSMKEWWDRVAVAGAAGLGSYDVLKVLLEYGATPLDITAYGSATNGSAGSRTDILDLLYEHGCDVEEEPCFNCYLPGQYAAAPLMYHAVRSKNTEALIWCLEHGAEFPGTKDAQFGLNYWDLASNKGNEAIAEGLEAFLSMNK